MFPSILFTSMNQPLKAIETIFNGEHYYRFVMFFNSGKKYAFAGAEF